MSVAVLFARGDSVYKTFPGCDVWDAERDATNYTGCAPVVAHPPCRSWGRYAHWAKPRPGEKELAYFALAAVRRVGGVLEHPADSKLWTAGGLPSPGRSDEFGGFTLGIHQGAFGHRAPKRTFLYIVGCRPGDVPPIPYQLGDPSGRIENMGVREREKTPHALAVWLVDLASRCALQ